MKQTTQSLKLQMTEPIMKAFEIMATHDIWGVAVVDDHGTLIANTSASDLLQLLRDPSLPLTVSSALSFAPPPPQTHTHTHTHTRARARAHIRG
jgi:CBS domain-containing protein